MSITGCSGRAMARSSIMDDDVSPGMQLEQIRQKNSKTRANCARSELTQVFQI